jgi:DNA-binding response OmpR family regulator
MTPSAISQNREKQNGAADCVVQRSGPKPAPGGNQMSSVSVLQQSFTADRASARSARSDEFPSRDIVEFGDFRIDLDNRTAALRGENLELTSQEFEVLMFLVNHPQRLITPRTVLATSWTTDRPRQTEFLPALLSLRKKLETAGQGKHYLRTEPWIVYRFDPNPSSNR